MAVIWFQVTVTSIFFLIYFVAPCILIFTEFIHRQMLHIY